MTGVEIEHLAELQAILKKELGVRFKYSSQEQWAAITLEVFRMMQAGIRYGWASRGLFDLRPLQDEKVARLTEDILGAYRLTGLPQMTRYTPTPQQLSKSLQ